MQDSVIENRDSVYFLEGQIKPCMAVIIELIGKSLQHIQLGHPLEIARVYKGFSCCIY